MEPFIFFTLFCTLTVSVLAMTPGGPFLCLNHLLLVNGSIQWNHLFSLCFLHPHCFSLSYDPWGAFACALTIFCWLMVPYNGTIYFLYAFCTLTVSVLAMTPGGPLPVP